MTCKQLVSSLFSFSKLSILSVTVLLLFAVTLTIAVFTPIYFDDIGYILSTGRAGYDNWHTINPQPYCKQSFATAVPFTLIPGRGLAWATHAIMDSLLIMRLVALCIILAWTGITSILIKTIFLTPLSWLHAFGLTAAMAGMGLVPFILIQSRPETALLLAITLYIALIFIGIKQHTLSRLYQIAMASMVLFLTSWFFSAHPKALLYIPLIWLACFYLPIRQILPRIAIALCVTFIAYQAYHYWQIKISCPGYEVAQKFRDSQALNAAQLMASPVDFISRFIDNVSHADRYVKKLMFKTSKHFMSWTTPIRATTWMHSINWVILATAILGALLIVWQLVSQFKHGIRRRHFITPHLAVITALLLSLLAQSGIQVPKSFYESGFIWLCILLIATMAMTNQIWTDKKRRILSIVLAAIMLLSINSQLALAISYIPATHKVIKKATRHGVVMGNSYRLSPLNYHKVAPRIRKVAKLCHINNDASSKHVAVDSSTYLALKETYQPYFLVGRSKKRSFPFLQKNDASGIVKLCHNLPDDITAIAIKRGGICCVSRQVIDAEIDKDKRDEAKASDKDHKPKK